MNILGIETSCDETAAAVVQKGRLILSNVVLSSLKEHRKYGGVIPEIASRKQLEYINPVVNQALKDARLNKRQIDAIAVTKSPGLVGSLLVGLSFARALALSLKKPLIEVDHIKAHLYANFLHFKRGTNGSKRPQQPKLPAVGLVVSGGHTSLYYLNDSQEFKLIGQTRDDAAGEAFDKVARILDLGYPGGPVIDKISRKVKKTDLRFTCAPLTDTLDFSFSGIKTAVLYYKKDHQLEKNFSIPKIAFSFQDAVVSVLVKKCVEACKKYKAQSLLIGGGVAANSRLRETLRRECLKEKIKVFTPPIDLCMDNAVMVAGLGFQMTQNGLYK